jgi:hypothetical protein
MLGARPDELKLALLALVSAAASEPFERMTCAELMDEATITARVAPPPAVRNVGPTANATTRVEAARLIATLCASCGACPRALTVGFQWGEAPPRHR